MAESQWTRSSGAARGLRLALAMLTAFLVVSCDRPYLGVRPVSLRVHGPGGVAAFSLLSERELPYVSAYVLDCTPGGCEGAEAIQFEQVSGADDARSMTDRRCADERSACELVFTPARPSLTVWLADGAYALEARAFAPVGGSPADFCIEGGLAMFDVGPGKANDVDVTLGECDDVVYFDSTAAAPGDGSRARPFNFLQDALDAAPAGGTVYVLAGTHEVIEPIFLDEPTTLAGVSYAGPGATPASQLRLSGAGILVESGDVTIRDLGIAIEPTGDAPDAAIAVQVGASGEPVVNFRLESATVQSPRHGIVLREASHALIQDVTVLKSIASDDAGLGIMLAGVEDVSIRATSVGNGDADTLFALGAIGLYTTADRGIDGVEVDKGTINGLDGSGSAKGRTIFVLDEHHQHVTGLRLAGESFAVRDGDPAGCPGGRATGDGYIDYARTEEEALTIATTCDGASSDTAVVRELTVEADGSIAAGTSLFVGPGMSIQTAVSAANIGDTVHVRSGATLTSTVDLNKPVTVTGVSGDDPDTKLVIATGINPAFNVTAAATISNLTLEKAENTAGTLIAIHANGVTIKGNTFSGQFDAPSLAGPASRAMVVAGESTDLIISGNTVHGLRQPAYFDAGSGPITGVVRGNTVFNTFGWVVIGAQLTFEGNYWNAEREWGAPSGNVKCDIALGPGTPSAPYDPIEDLAAANGGTLLNLGSGDNSCDMR